MISAEPGLWIEVSDAFSPGNPLSGPEDKQLLVQVLKHVLEGELPPVFDTFDRHLLKQVHQTLAYLEAHNLLENDSQRLRHAALLSDIPAL